MLIIAFQQISCQSVIFGMDMIVKNYAFGQYGKDLPVV